MTTHTPQHEDLPVPLTPCEAGTPAEEFAKLQTQIATYITEAPSLEMIEKAYHYALALHEGQVRRSGEPYVTHPIAVAMILATLRVDPYSIVAALLHDVVEDTTASVHDIEERFGPVTGQLVDGLTKIGKIKFRSNQERMAENFRKMIVAMAKDLRVIVVKLADRLHNMRTLGCLAKEKRLRIAQETLDIYAPLAGRLGIYGIKSELEDLCLKETKNTIYKEISSKIATKKRERESMIREVKDVLDQELTRYGFKGFIVYGRPKHFFSIYRKMVDRRIAFEDIHDLFAFRIIVDSVKDCYEALGVVHAIWKPMPGRFKDYIAIPKANFYQSLHTTVIRPNGHPAEIQIRTHDMQHICEYGVAAHWSYKEKGGGSSGTDLNRFTWLRKMMELQDDVKDPSEFLSAVKLDLFEDEIFVFTPKGDVIQLGSGATPVDFAFAVHTGVGLSTIGAKVNGKITPLRNRLNSGDIVEVMTSPHQKPSKDWLNFVTTSKARNKIRSFLRSEQRESSKKIGHDLLHHELGRRGVDLDKLVDSTKIEGLVKAGRESNYEDLLIAIGYGKVQARDIVKKVYPEDKPPQTLTEEGKQLSQKAAVKPAKNSQSGVLVSGIENILVTFGRCCNPLPGETIVGFITRGRGVSIHRDSCLRALDLDPARRIEVSWADNEAKQQTFHTVYLKVVTHDRQGVLAAVTSAISSCGANILKAEVQISPDKMGVLDFEVSLRDLSQLTQVVNRVESLEDILVVERRSTARRLKPFKRRPRFSG